MRMMSDAIDWLWTTAAFEVLTPAWAVLLVPPALLCAAGVASMTIRAGTFDAFSPATARTLLLVSDIVYCGDDTHPRNKSGLRSILAWSCPPCRFAAGLGNGGEVTNVSIFQNPLRQTFGLVGTAACACHERG